MLTRENYRPRVVDSELRELLDTMGAVLIQGPKWCGKTTTGAQCAGTVVSLDNPADRERNQLMSELEPSRLLSGEEPVLLDEWQLAPRLWDAARWECDQRGGPGHFIFTGSSTPQDRSEILHSGTGRFGFLTMRTMSLYESGESTGAVSVRSLFDGARSGTYDAGLSLEAVARLVCRGGWPGCLRLREGAQMGVAGQYYEALVREDMPRVGGVIYDRGVVESVIRSLARHQGAAVGLEAIVRDSPPESELEFDLAEAVGTYLRALQRMFVTEDLPAWQPNLRSRAVARATPVRYYSDPSIAATALGATPAALLRDLNTFGLLFETLALRDLRVYSGPITARVARYRDKEGLECDAVVELRDGRYGLVEMKLGGKSAIEAGAATLIRLSARLDEASMGAPAFMMVLTATGQLAYPRPDGVWVVPIGVLGP